MANVFRGPLYSLKGLVRPFVGFVAANLLLTTLGVAPGPAPFAQTDWPISHPRVELRVEPPPNLLGTTLAPVVAAPFTQTDWFLPARPLTKDLTWTQSILRGALGVDPRTQTDWPLPREKKSREGLTWVWTSLPEILARTDPFTQTDWPLPREPVRQNLTQEYQVQLVLRTDFKTPDVVVFDWPLPRGRVREDLTWVWTPLPEKLARTDPFVPTDYSLFVPPQQIRFEVPPNLQTSTLAVVQAPFTQTDWTILRETTRLNLSWTQDLLQSTLFVEALPFRQLDWPLAVLRYNRDLSWVHDLGVLASARTDPFISLDFPVIQRVSKPDFIVVPNLLTNTLATVEVAPFVQLDWPNPPKIAYSIVIPNWICIRNLPLQAAVCPPATSFVMILND